MKKFGKTRRVNVARSIIRHRGFLYWAVWRHRRVMVLVNIAAIPYVWVRFPKEARRYTSDCVKVLWRG